MDTTSPVKAGTVVVGIDGSHPADRALAWAARQAALEHRALTIVIATGPLHQTWLGPPAVDLDALRASTAAYASTTMAAATSWVTSHEPGVAVHTVVTQTDPREELLERSATAAMVVVGSRGRGPVRTLLLGSVSAALSSHADCPVVVVRPDDADGPKERHGVLVGVQEAAASRPLLQQAFGLAAARGLPLTVLQCLWDGRFDDGSVGTAPVAADPDGAARHRTHLEQVVAATAAGFPGVEVTTRQQHGFVDRILIELSPTMDATVVGSHHPNLLRRTVYGSLARTVLEHAAGVVVVVPLVDVGAATAPDVVPAG